MKKPYLSTYEVNLENDVFIDGRTRTDSVEDTDCDISSIFHLGGTNHTNTLEDTDLDNLLQIDKVYNDKV
jgi:hypothetical protein